MPLPYPSRHPAPSRLKVPDFWALFSTSLLGKFPGGVRRLQRLADHRLWGLWLALLATGLSWFMSCPTWPSDHHHWAPYEAKASAPFVSLADQYSSRDHASKLDFRMTVPVVAKALGLQRGGIRALYLALSIGTLWMAYSLFLKHSRDKVSSSLFTLGLAAIPMGSEALFGRFFFDPAAFFLATACLRTRNAWLLVALLFCLSFVDERAFTMFPAIALYHALRTPSGVLALHPVNWKRPALCLLAAPVLHGLARLWLQETFSLTLPLLDSGIYGEWLVRNLRYSELMLLATLEFSWLWAIPVLYLLWRWESPLVSLLFLAVLGFPMASALWVADVGRSMNYALPAFLTLALMLPRLFGISSMRSLLLASAVLNLLFWNVDYIESPRPSPPAITELGRLLVQPKPMP